MKNFKKLIAVILTVLMVAAIPMTAFAAPHTGTPIGNQGVQDAFVMEAAKLGIYTGGDFPEEEMWDYDENYLYVDDDGTVWRFASDMNWIVSKENNQWLYRELDDGTLYIMTNSDVEIDQNLAIPSVLEGKTVTKVRNAGRGTANFNRASTLSITIPDTVTSIEYGAFRNKGKLRRVVIPTSVKSIEVGAFGLTDNIELYYTGTEEQWNDIIVWSHTSFHDPANHWAVTNFNWLEYPYEGRPEIKEPVKAVHFNVNPDELEPLVEEEEPVEPTLFEKLVSGITGIIATITGFFKGIFDFFGSIF